jgi:hypothetical protein
MIINYLFRNLFLNMNDIELFFDFNNDKKKKVCYFK